MCLPIIYQGQDQRLHEQDIKLGVAESYSKNNQERR